MPKIAKQSPACDKDYNKPGSIAREVLRGGAKFGREQGENFEKTS